MQRPMRFKPPNCMRLQGAADARRRARRRTFVLQVPENNADAVPCERIQKFYTQNINHMPAVIFFARLDLEPICLFLDGHYEK